MIEMGAPPSSAAKAMMIHPLEPIDPQNAAVEGGTTKGAQSNEEVALTFCRTQSMSWISQNVS
jgi:hypothetical protein